MPVEILVKRVLAGNSNSFLSCKNTSLKRTFFSFFQLWWLAILEPVGVQRQNVLHFKGLIVLYLNSRSSRLWQYFYLLPRPWEKGHFTPKNGYCAVWLAPYCMLLAEYLKSLHYIFFSDCIINDERPALLKKIIYSEIHKELYLYMAFENIFIQFMDLSFFTN